MVADTDASNAPADEALARSTQAQLIESLRHSAGLNPPTSTEQVSVIETHISYVLLAGEYAYKIKKAVRLPFLDFSTRHCRLYKQAEVERPINAADEHLPTRVKNSCGVISLSWTP